MTMADETFEFEQEVFTLTDEEGNESDFELIGNMELDGNKYVALIPVDSTEDEYVILKVTTDENGVGHFYGHGNVSYEKVKEILKRLKFSNEEYNLVTTLVKYHDAYVEPTEKAVRVRADVKTEGPDASARTDSVGITDARKGAVGVTDTEIGLYLPGVLHIVKTSARKHRDMPHVRVTAHRPKLAVGVAIHRRSAVLINAETIEKRRFGFTGYA